MRFGKASALFILIAFLSSIGHGWAALDLADEGWLAQPDEEAFPAGVITPDQVDPFHVLLVDKSRQILYLYHYQSNGRPKFIGSYPCSTGMGRGDKLKEGDRRTPEGVYFFTKVYKDNKITIYGTTAYHINYPDVLDEASGRQGNGIYLHGTNRPLGSRATRGCVVMDNKDLDFLGQHVQIHDTPIIISRKLNWLKEEDWQRERDIFKAYLAANGVELARDSNPTLPKGAGLRTERAVLLRENGRTLARVPVVLNDQLIGWRRLYLEQYPDKFQVLASKWQPLEASTQLAASPSPPSRREEILAFLADWVKAWESRDVERYLSFYSPGFKAYGMNFDQWRAYKTKLVEKYNAIDVQISDIKVKIKGDIVEARFHQVYVSDQFEDIGHKTLKIVRSGKNWKIWREDWRPSQAAEARR